MEQNYVTVTLCVYATVLAKAQTPLLDFVCCPPVVKVENLEWGNSIFSVSLQPWRQGPSDAAASEYLMPYLPFFFSVCTCVSLIIRLWSSIILHRCCHLVVYNCSVPPTVPVHCYELGGTGTLIANYQGTPFDCVHFNHCCPRSSLAPLKPRQHGALQILYCIVLYCIQDRGQTDALSCLLTITFDLDRRVWARYGQEFMTCTPAKVKVKGPLV